ncbi:AAA family ATPase [Spelaeicoccus albus]|uniref:Nuclease SbcCD subunit C n=1 Tax=Spelaeicoccus albus TaxID=1280376 RepID=A0A7Z0CZH8_9MICO|nr:AAA family ATPase [Spelaeicoccus albus]NYI66294.1 recombinational DNA repair ATPase RecF [Spelaeicoccus albus]
MIKIEMLRINNFRGIRSFDFKMDEKSFVVEGRNGTGKSGVIDALEFALTGSITRLTGRGSAGVSVKSHASHVDMVKTPKDAWVEMTFTVVGTGSSHVLKRTVAKPREPALTPHTLESEAALNWMVQHPEFALTRREIVRFVLAEGKSRGEGVADLLGLQRIGQARSTLVRVRNVDKRDSDIARTDLSGRKDKLLSASGIETLDGDALLTVVNTNRIGLGLRSVVDVNPEGIVAGVDSSASKSASLHNRPEWINELSILEASLKASLQDDVDGQLGQLVDDAARRTDSVEFMTALKSDDLLESALELFEGVECPVCATTWLPGEFEAVVARKRVESTAAKNALTALSARSGLLVPRFSDLQNKISDVLPIAEAMDHESTATKQQLEIIRAAINTLLSVDSPSELAALAVLAKSNMEPISAWLSELQLKVQALPLPSESDERKGRLRSMSHALDEYKQQQQVASELSEKSRRSSAVCKVFESSTSTSLEQIYLDVQTKFASFYAAVNADDESQFSATLTPSGAGLDMNVDFYGRGQYPPGAYHSEGHQDAMGLCLYLALAQLTMSSKFTLCALDDVLMSIDSGHRRLVVSLLMKEFPNTQFVVTTHDEQWMRQMKSQGFAQGRNVLQFRTWSVDSGPVDWANYEPWDEISTFLGKGQVKAAAGSLRSYLEHIGRECASNVAAPVPYRLDGQNTLGELFNSSIKALRATIKKGKNSANSWGHSEIVAELDAWDTQIQAAAQEAKQDEWAINTVVHFNEWENQTPAEFALVAKSWRCLIKEFSCSECEGLVRIGGDQESLRCACTHVSVNLLGKS